MQITLKNTIALVILAAAVSFAIGAWWSNTSGTQAAAPGGRRILYYHDPMHPAYKSDKPGIAPDCGMDLEPVYADDPAGGAGSPEAGSMPPGTVRVNAEKQQLMGVRVVEIRKDDAEHTVHFFGRVTSDESRLYRVKAPGDGLVREISGVTSGSLVEKDQTLAAFYSRESLSLNDQQSYLSLLAGGGQPNVLSPGVKSTPGRNLYAEFARDSLTLFGMSDSQLKELEQTRSLFTTIRITSPAKGVVLSRDLFPAERFEKGSELYRIADLSNVWVLTDVFENEARLLGSVTGVSVKYQDSEYPARMSSVPPQFDPATRTLKVRLDVGNPGYVLRPDMFVDVAFKVKLRSTLVAPVDAVLDSGLRKTVFVERGNGYFEPRRVETGQRLGDQIVIRSGLSPGERVVWSGNFLIDSESRLQLAAAAADSAAGKDPVCGMKVDPAKSSHKSQHEGSTHYFCSADCKARFDKEPSKYLGKAQSAMSEGAR